MRVEFTANQLTQGDPHAPIFSLLIRPAWCDRD